MEWKTLNLDNGVSLVYKRVQECYSVAMGIFVRSGVRYETPEYSGISHFVEHLLFKGTHTRSARELKEAIEGKGGSFNAFTAEELTCYHIKILQQHIETGIEILSDMIKNPLFKSEEIDKERNVILEEINMYRDIPSRQVYELLDRIMFTNHPLGTSGLGTPETLKNIDREALLKYTDRFHKGKNIVVSVAGKFDEDKLFQLIEKHLGKIHEGEKSSFVPFNTFKDDDRYNVEIRKTEQCHFCIGFYAYPREDERKFPMTLASTILGGNMSSRLFNEVRENRGLVYNIGSYVKSYHDTGAAVISAGLCPENLIECISVIKDQLNNIINVRVSEEELERAKEYLVSQFLMGFEDPMKYMIWLGEQKTTRKKMLSLKEVEEKIRNVKVEDIQNVCNDIFNKKPFFALIGPEDKKENVSKILEAER